MTKQFLFGTLLNLNLNIVMSAKSFGTSRQLFPRKQEVSGESLFTSFSFIVYNFSATTRRFLAQHSGAMLNNAASIRNNIAVMLQRCVVLKIVVAIRLVRTKSPSSEVQ